jgi:NAD(P)-dependent dehydrogenase (short-subunit alcohol dehydrogenase family)
MKHFSGRVALVTGGASGIGYGIVRKLLEQGMKVVVVDYNPDYLDEARQEYAGNAAVHVVRADVGDRDQVRAAAAEAVRVFGKIHVLCNNAGVTGGGNVEDADFDAWDKALRVNLGGVVNGVKIIAPLIIAHGEGGHIVNTASMAAAVPNPLPGLGAYVTAKYAVRGLTDSLRYTLARHGIGASCLFPGGTRSRILDSIAQQNAEVAKIKNEMLVNWMDPLEMGVMVVEAIRNNSPYIFTHEEFLDEMRERHREIEASFPTGQIIPSGRAAFEGHRRAVVAEALAMKIKD